MNSFSYDDYRISLQKIALIPKAIEVQVRQQEALVNNKSQRIISDSEAEVVALNKKRQVMQKQYDDIREECAILDLHWLPSSQKPIYNSDNLAQAITTQNNLASEIVNELKLVRNKMTEAKRKEKEKQAAQEKTKVEQLKQAEEQRRRQEEERKRKLQLEYEKRLKDEARNARLKSYLPFVIAIIVIAILVLVLN